MALKARTIIESPGLLLLIFNPLLLLYIINFGLSTITAKIFFNRGDGIALVYGTVMRNLSIALAYIIQVHSAAWYVKFTDGLFGTDAKNEQAF